MPQNFMSIRMHVTDEREPTASALAAQTQRMRGSARRENAVSFTNDESAARYYLSRVLGRDERLPVRGLTAPSRPEVVPDMRLVEVLRAPARRAQPVRSNTTAGPPPSGTTLVRFEQTRADIPIFGSRATVEISASRDLVSIEAAVADVAGVSPVAALSPSEALARVARAAEVSPDTLGGLSAPRLTYFAEDHTGQWHLAYLFQKVPAASRDAQAHRGHGLGRSPRDLRPLVNYLVDAHDGEVLLRYSTSPTAAGVVRCQGEDEDGRPQWFYGSGDGTAGYSMYDPLRALRTYDLSGSDISSPFPDAEVTSPRSKPWQGAAAVSAHVNAMRVHQFLATVLGRDSIDDKGMEIVSVVNCTYAEDQPPPEWHNAVWYDNRMWYGQTREGERLRSFARFLDIIGHELAHGMTDFTAGLVYQGQSGALNESVSDIFGLIVRNWFDVGPDSDVAGWNWEIGPGLGKGGLPLRDMRCPARTADPAHMDAYNPTEADWGGVHINSNIHNRAAYNLLNRCEADGSRALRPSDVAVLYYVALQRLSSLATFADMRHALRESAKTYFGDPDERARMLAHIDAAYDEVGIR